MRGAYYNEIDPDAAAILRELIADGVIAPGDVDTRSIKEVHADDLRGYAQCHFFAGGGLWSVASRLAGWPDDEPLWTGSCPCQPFSVAGKGGGADDPRHLWPDFFRLISAARPPVVMGEQVAGKAGRDWFHGVRSDLAGGAYGARAVDIPACAVDAPHIRQRLYWIAVDDALGHRQRPSAEQVCSGRLAADVADAAMEYAAGDGRREGWAEPELRSGRATIAVADTQGDMGNPGSVGRPQAFGEPAHGTSPNRKGTTDSPERAYSAHGRNGSFWAGADWIICHDQKARRTKPGLPLLVDGLPGRVGLWRVAGNAISPVLAAEVLKAFMETVGTDV